MSMCTTPVERLFGRRRLWMTPCVDWPPLPVRLSFSLSLSGEEDENTHTIKSTDKENVLPQSKPLSLPLSSLFVPSSFFVELVDVSRSLLASAAAVVTVVGVGDVDWCGRKGADTGRRLAVIPAEPEVGDVTGEPVDPMGIPALLRLLGRLTSPEVLPGTVAVAEVFSTTVAAAVTVGPASGAASSNLNWTRDFQE